MESGATITFFMVDVLLVRMTSISVLDESVVRVGLLIICLNPLTFMISFSSLLSARER